MKYIFFFLAAIFCCTPGFAKELDIQAVIEQCLPASVAKAQPDWGGCWILDLQHPDSLFGCEFERVDTGYINSGTKHLQSRYAFGTLLVPLCVLARLDDGSLSQDTLLRAVIRRTGIQDTMITLSHAIASGDLSVNQFLPKPWPMNKPEEIIAQYRGLLERSTNPEDVHAHYIIEALHRVVWDYIGTAGFDRWYNQPKAQSNIVHIMGKTGTAGLQMADGTYSLHHHRISFVGIFPEETPRYICLAVLDNPKGHYDAGRDCGGLIRLIAEDTN